MSKIFNLLPVGEENAVSLKALSAQTGLPERALRSQIVAELEDGSPCLSSCKPHGGYYRPDTGEKGLKEMQRFYQQERSKFHIPQTESHSPDVDPVRRTD